MFVIRSITFSMLLSLAACSSTPPAPVVDRLPSGTSSTPEKPATLYKSGDWRPDTYTVKKGDTLFSIGLEYGYDYKELAEMNHITAPYIINIGQNLNLKSSNALETASSDIVTSESLANADGVTTFPLNNDDVTVTDKSIEPNTPVAGSVAILKTPKVIREPYSEEAFNRPIPTVKTNTAEIKTETKSAEAKASEIKTTEVKPVTKTSPETKFETVENIDWAWPHNGKVIAPFNESSNKGLDIAGSLGQAVNAAAAGKVIYSGSDLRGYGKLVIIKHNALYLSVYAHNSMIVVKEGQQVSRGQKISEIGNTESSTVKLHFEIRRQGKSVDPKQYLPAS